MPSFNPKTEYEVVSRGIPIRDFHEYKEEFVVRPPYQRKSVWSTKKQQALLDSLFRRYYVPRIVLREVRLGGEATVMEVVDGQQRITTAQLFFEGELPLPNSLKDVHGDLPGRYYGELPVDKRRFVDRELEYQADIVKRISDPRDPDHQHVATEIFWRLQQGESLNYMEVAHARLSSVARNFVVKYADDITFDYEAYQPVDGNASKHPYFNVIQRANDRMQHLALLTRFLIMEEADGPAQVRETHVRDYIDQYEREDGIGSDAFENEGVARRTLSHMKAFYETFKDDPSLGESSDGMPEFKTEYFIISTYLLLRHLRNLYVFDEAAQELFRTFVYAFHGRWRAGRDNDLAVLTFRDNRQQSEGAITTRHRIIRQLFFEHVEEQGSELVTKDAKRVFSEAERIRIYRRDSGLCQACLEEEKPEEEARVPWNEYEADHVVPHTRGGDTAVANGQVLCRYHNRSKGATVEAQ